MKTHLTRRQFGHWGAAALALGAGAAARAQDAAKDWPGKAVRIINPFPVGGGPDGTSRLIADKLARIWGQSVIVENRPGGNGFIAIDAFKRGAKDGTDIIQLDNVHLAAYPHLFRKLPYDIEKDFAVVLPLFRTFFFVCVAQDSPYKTMADLVEDAKKRPGELNYGSWSVGNPVHLGSALLESLIGTKMEHVVYKETGQLYTGVATGELAFALGSSGTAGPLARSGKLRFLAVLAPHRLKGFEDIPTVAESGGPQDALVTGWNAFAVARETPPEVVEKIRKDTAAALAEPDVQPKFQTFGYENYFPTQEEFLTFMQEENQRFGDVIRRAKIEL